MVSWLTSALIGLGVQVSAGFITGFLAGYAAKKIAKVIAVILGAFILALMGLNYLGIIIIRWERIIGLGEEAITWIETRGTPIASFMLVNLPIAATFLAGFALGLKKG